MKQIVPILLTVALLLAGCSSNSNTETTSQEETASIVETSTVEKTAASESETELTTEESSIPEPSKELQTSELFESVYVPYARRQNPFAFNSVKAFAQSTNYTLDIKEPTAESVGTIILTDENDDYVYFGFNEVNGIETIMTVSFYQASTDSEVSMSNYSTDGSTTYDQYSTHIVGSGETKVNGSADQRIFLFQ